MTRAAQSLVLSSLLACGTVLSSPAPSPTGVDFNRDIRPILSDNCFQCHGPDEQERKAGLRFDLPDAALKPAKSGEIAIVPRDPAKSSLMARITTGDVDDLMPPPKTGKKLTARQIDLLRSWIAQGAHYSGHWAFEKPQSPALPPVKNSRWPRNEIDRFVLAQLESVKLKPSPEADKVALLRRANLDLIGLPPTVEEIDAFLADKSPQAYEKLVDRLLEKPQYGEHMARYWMDGARYADSHGFHIDSERSLWKWRDWAVDAFNRNLPYDQFTTEQLAGDLIPSATTEQKVASGFVRCNMSTGEGGAIEEEYQAKYTFDRVETTSALWLGLTMTCARCHTHKYDPISQKEYYSLYWFFNQLNESVMDGNRPNPDPFIKVPSPAQSRRLDELKQWIVDGQRKLDAAWPELDPKESDWRTRWQGTLQAGVVSLRPTQAKSAATNGPALSILDDGTVQVAASALERDTREIVYPLEPGLLAGIQVEIGADVAVGGGARTIGISEIEAEVVVPDDAGKPGKPRKLKFALAETGAAEAGSEAEKAIDGKGDSAWAVKTIEAGALSGAWFVLAEPENVAKAVELRVRVRSEIGPKALPPGRIRLAAARSGLIASALHPPKPGTWKVLGPLKPANQRDGFERAYEPETRVDLSQALPGVREEARWNTRAEFEDGRSHLLVQDLHGVHGVYYLYRTFSVPTDRRVTLSMRADGLFKIWVNGLPVAARDSAEKPGDGKVRATVDLKAGENQILVKVSTLQGAAYFAFNHELGGEDSLSPPIAALLALAPEPSSPAGLRVRQAYRRSHSEEFRKLQDDAGDWREEQAAIDRAIPTTMVARELDKPRETRLLMRGEYDQKGPPVGPGVPAILNPWPAHAPTNRLGLAMWLLSPDNPLTARVTVNRFWQQYFGVGLVKTAEDFGVQGEAPSHPALLDYLATEFLRSGWDVKHLQRLIVTSATYRQSSKASTELRARDPENRLLARGPRFRMDGEVVRDTALAVGGLLVERLGGPSAKPYEPPGLWEAVSYNNAQKYVPDIGEGRHRRSLYTHWKRQSPPPNMMIFDAPTREYCVVRRPRTNTPLQALVLLNDPQFVEASQSFAQRIMLEGGRDPADRVRYAFRLATGRSPASAEVKILIDAFARQLQGFRQRSAAAADYLAAGGFTPRPGVDPAELAAWSTVASMILNLDETLTKG